ncbi:hypothetical protein AVEN_18749-1 [Araneus ventricosus]|uniref:Uncharacterized protein n=1 Tax=Araneus ventricosus TaxID=182803 RepID=A0A4Y2G608_ARAVE|nr:hypothetical protein AVEN_18749-1 [Araneus ventricosus]
MKLAIEQFSSILCIGFTASSSIEEGDLCCEMRQYKDLEYDQIFDSVQMFGLKYSKEFTEVIGKIFMTDIKDGLASKSKFMCFVLSRCMQFTKTPTFLSFILICIFVHKVVSDIFRFLEIECFTVAKMASKCLIAAFYRCYVDLFDKENGFEGLANYCEKLNEIVIDSSDEDSESKRSSVSLEVYTFPNNDEIIGMIYSLKEIDGVDILLTDFEKKLLYELDSLSLDIDPSEDIFIPLHDSSESNKMKGLDIAMPNLNIKSKHILERLDELCPLCKDNCYKHVVFAAKELEVGEI